MWLALSAGIGWTFRSAEKAEILRIKARLEHWAALAAQAIDAETHEEIVCGGFAEHSAFEPTMAALARFHREHSELTYVYTVVRDGAGAVRFVFDTAAVVPRPAWAEAYVAARPGQVYEKVDPALVAAFDLPGPSSNDRLHEDEFGTYFSGFAPLRTADGRAVGVVGVDLEKAQFEATLAPVRRAAIWALGLGALVAVTLGLLARQGLVQAQRQIHHGETRHRRILEASLDVITLVDAAGRILYKSPAAERLLGKIEGNIAGADAFALIHPDDVPALRTAFERLLASPGMTLHGLEYRLRRADGDWVPVEAVAINRLHEPAVRAIVVSSRDITERLHAARARAALENQVRQTQKYECLGVLAGGIAHDFNNLLTAILGHASLLRMDVDPGSRALAALDHIDQSAAQASQLCKQLLAYSGRGAFDLRPVSVPVLLDEHRDAFVAALPPAARLEFHYPAHLPAVLADATHLRQLLLNLLTNAGEALPPDGGSVTVSLSATTAERETQAGYAYRHHPRAGLAGGYLAIEVSDTGCGIEPAVLDRIFDPFFTTKTPGRGLGLAAAFGIVKSHRGAIGVRSQVGQGTVMRLLLPVTDRPTTAPPRGASSSITLAEAAPGSVALPTPGWAGRALVADQEPTVRRVAQRLLQRRGYHVETVATGEEALQRLCAPGAEWDVAVIDRTLPGFAHDDPWRELRRFRPGLPVVLTSGSAGLSPLASLAGPVGFLAKPFTDASLAEAVTWARSQADRVAQSGAGGA